MWGIFSTLMSTPFMLDQQTHSDQFYKWRKSPSNRAAAGHDCWWMWSIHQTAILTVHATTFYDSGHYLGHQQTIDLMESDYVYPRSADRNLPDDWQYLGATDVWQQANQILSAYFSKQIESATDELIRSKFPIRLKLPTRSDNHEQ